MKHTILPRKVIKELCKDENVKEIINKYKDDFKSLSDHEKLELIRAILDNY